MLSTSVAALVRSTTLRSTALYPFRRQRQNPGHSPLANKKYGHLKDIFGEIRENLFNSLCPWPHCLSPLPPARMRLPAGSTKEGENYCLDRHQSQTHSKTMHRVKNGRAEGVRMAGDVADVRFIPIESDLVRHKSLYT